MFVNRYFQKDVELFLVYVLFHLLFFLILYFEEICWISFEKSGDQNYHFLIVVYINDRLVIKK